MSGSRANIRRVLDQADAIDIGEGRVAYYRYREVCVGLAGYYGYPLETVVAAFAALSPNNDYLSNLRSTATVLRGHKAGTPVERLTVSTYNHCRDRAYAYLSGVGFLETVKGKKIRSFYRNILNPIDPHPVTIDGHAVNVWRGTRVNLKRVVEIRFNYEEVAEDYRAVARSVRLLPCQLQSITWFTWKRIHRIYYPGRQLELFRDVTGDFWRTLISPEEVIPFA